MAHAQYCVLPLDVPKIITTHEHTQQWPNNCANVLWNKSIPPTYPHWISLRDMLQKTTSLCYEEGDWIGSSYAIPSSQACSMSPAGRFQCSIFEGKNTCWWVKVTSDRHHQMLTMSTMRRSQPACICGRGRPEWTSCHWKDGCQALKLGH